MSSEPKTAPNPLSITAPYERGLALTEPFSWLRMGVRDTFTSPASSLLYGLAVLAISYGLIAALYEFGLSYILLPAVAGFMIVGPLIAVGTYEKSRLLERGQETVSAIDMIRVRPKSPGQLMFVGVIMLMVMLFWLRTAILLYALFYGLRPVVGVQETIEALFFTERGLTLLMVGTGIGAALASFAFSVCAFSVPLLMNERKDAITAMVVSLVMAWANKGVAFVWGALVLVLFLVCVATGLLGLIVLFPVLGHATWHAYRAMRSQAAIDESRAYEASLSAAEQV